MQSRHRLLKKRAEETADRDPLVAWALALWLSRYDGPSYEPYRLRAEAQLKAAREQGKMDSKWPLRAKLQTDPVIAYALLQAAQWRPQGLSLTWQEMKELDKLRERLGSAAEERIVEFETHAALQDFDQLATSNPGEALDLAAQLDIAPGVYNHPYGAKLSVGQRAALQARVLTLRTERDRLARRQEANQLESDFRQRYEARLPEQARTLAERLFAPPPDFEVPVVLLGGRETSLLASRLRYARVSLEEPGMGRTKQGVVQNVHASPLRVVAKDPHLSAPQEWNLSRPGTRLIVEGLAPPLPDDILHGPPADFLSPEKRAWVEQARDELQQVLANPSGQRFWLLDFDDPVAPSEAGLQEPGEPSRFSVLEFDFDGPPPPKPTPPPKPVPTPPRAEADRALREFRAGLARDARTQAELAGHTLVRHWKLLTEAEQNEVRAGLAQLELRRSSRFANLEVDEPELLNEPVPVEEGPNRFKLLEIDAPPDSVQKLIDRWRRLVIGVQEAAPGRGVPADHAAQWLRQHKRRLLVALGGTPASVDAALAIPAVPPAPAGPPAAPAPPLHATPTFAAVPAGSFSMIISGAEPGRHGEGLALLRRLGFSLPNRLLVADKQTELAHQLTQDEFDHLRDHLEAAGVMCIIWDTDRATRMDWINKELRTRPRPDGLVYLLAHGMLPPVAPAPQLAAAPVPTAPAPNSPAPNSPASAAPASAAPASAAPASAASSGPSVTRFGATMSPRATKLYGFLHQRGIHMTTYSTDQTVAHYQPQLVEALAVAQVGGDANLVRDLQALMRRLPEHRGAVVPGGPTGGPGDLSTIR